MAIHGNWGDMGRLMRGNQAGRHWRPTEVARGHQRQSTRREHAPRAVGKSEAINSKGACTSRCGEPTSIEANISTDEILYSVPGPSRKFPGPSRNLPY